MMEEQQRNLHFLTGGKFDKEQLDSETTQDLESRIFKAKIRVNQCEKVIEDIVKEHPLLLIGIPYYLGIDIT